MNKSVELATATQRALLLFDNANISANLFEKTIGVAQGTIKNLKNGKNLISADCIIKFARYFKVSADYLLCLTDEPKPLECREVAQATTATPMIFGQMSELCKEQRFVDTAKLYNELPDQYRERVLGLVMGIAVGLGLNVEKILGK